MQLGVSDFDSEKEKKIKNLMEIA